MVLAKLGLFGGSFDPIHSGHVAGALAACTRLELDRVLFLPTGCPPHKPGRRFAPELLRYAMVEMALLEHPNLWVSDHELRTDRPSYSIETVEWFRRRNPDTQLFLLVGADAYRDLDQWVRWRDLVALTTLVVLHRPGYALEGADVSPALVEAIAETGRIERIEIGSEASATAIRLALASGAAPPLGWLPAPVLDCCRKYSLYR